MSASRERIRAKAAGVPAGLAVLCVAGGVAIAALVHSPTWSAPPAILGLIGYGIFARRAMRLWHGPGVPCLHLPACWPGARTRGSGHGRLGL